jgi:HlyD family secretion protein
MAISAKSILKKRKTLIGAGVALVIVAPLFFLPGSKEVKSAARPKETAAVMRGEMKITVEAKGLFQAEKSVFINPEVDGEATLTFLAPEGTTVKKGDVLAKFNTQDLEDEITDLSLRLETVRNRVTRAEESLKMQENTNETSVTAAEVALRMARLADDQYGTVLLTADGLLDEAAYSKPGAPAEGDAYQAFRDADLDIKRAKSDLEQAQTDFNGMDKLLDKGFVSKSDYLAAQLAVDEGKKNVEAKTLAYQILKNYTYPQTVAKNHQAVKAAEDALKSEQITASVKINQAETALRTAQLEYGRRKRRLDDHKEQLVKRTVISPIDGSLLYGDPAQPWWKDHIGVGQQVWHGMRLFTIPDLSSIIIQTRLLENDVFSATVGREADITVDAIPGLVMKGKVTKVAEYASTSNNWLSRSNTKAFDATLSVEGTDPRIKPGMSCVVNILLDTIADALYVPVSAVARRGDKDFCMLDDGAAEHAVEVKTGRMSEKYVEILSGLSAGQKVLLSGGETQASEPGQPSASKSGGG